MTVMPGSLDYLYYNGVLDHIPYEAYEMVPVNNASNQQVQQNSTPNYVNAPNFSNQPQVNNKQDYLQGGIQDTFEYSNNTNIDNPENKNFKKISNKGKGLIGAAVILLTIIGIIKGGGKKTAGTTKTGFFAKINPKNWFKK